MVALARKNSDSPMRPSKRLRIDENHGFIDNENLQVELMEGRKNSDPVNILKRLRADENHEFKDNENLPFELMEGRNNRDPDNSLKRLRTDENHGFIDNENLRLELIEGRNNSDPIHPKLRVDENYGFIADENYGIQANDKFRNPFSRLPSELIICILLCLPTLCAVRTCVLSKYWRNMWTDINSIQLDDKGEFRDKDRIREKGKLRGKFRTDNFITSVNSVLDATKNLTLRGFHVSCKTYNASLIETWIDKVLNRKIQHLVIEAKARGTVVLDLENTKWISLTKLKLSSNCTLQIPGKVYFPNLKSLYLSGRRPRNIFRIENVAPAKKQVLLIMPILEELILKHCMWLNVKRVEIQAPELIRFMTHGQFSDCKIMMCAAKLEKFESKGHIDDFNLTNAPSVNCVALSHCLETEIEKWRALKILKAVSGLKHLKLSSGMIKYFAKDLFAAIRNLSQVKQLEIWYWGMYDPEHMLLFLHQLPSLEYLSLSLAYEKEEFVYNIGQALPLCFASNLKEVQFTYFHARQRDHIDTFKFFMENAKNLQRAVVCVDQCQPRMTKTAIRDLLLPYLPESSSCKIVVTLQRRSHLGVKS